MEHVPYLRTQMVEVKAVADYIIGCLALGVKRKLLFISLFELCGIPATRSQHPLKSNFVRGIYEDESIAVLVELAFKQQWAILDDRDNIGVRLVLLTLARTAFMDPWVNDALQFTQRGGVCKDNMPKRGPIDGPI